MNTNKQQFLIKLGHFPKSAKKIRHAEFFPW